LSAPARAAILDPANDLFLSAVSAWEIARKHASGSLNVGGRPEAVIPAVRKASGIFSLPFTEDDALAAENLPLLHKDPFDRMLVAQALLNGMVVVTCNSQFERYPVRLLW
jgi:PIN domain nuclease of toxin-antitoxin system